MLCRARPPCDGREDVMPDTREFDKWAPHYDRSPAQWLVFAGVHRATLRAVQDAGLQPATLLDVGAATGRLLRQAHKLWPHARLIGVDPSSEMLEHARRASPDAEFLSGSAESLPLADGSVAVAVTTLSFHHWENQEQGLGEIFRVLQAGGLLVLADLAPPRWLARRLHHGHTPSLSERDGLLQAAGFRRGRRTRVLAGTVAISSAWKPEAPRMDPTAPRAGAPHPGEEP